MKKSLLFLSFALAMASMTLAFAQTAGATNAASSTAPSAGGGNGQRAEKWKAAFEQLDLTDVQKTQIQQIRANTQAGPERRQQIMAVLTPDQKQKLIGMLKQARAAQAGQ